MKWSSSIRKWSRLIHRDLSFFFAGMVLIYAISGIVMNHRDTINPNFSIERKEYKIAEKLPGKEGMKRENVLHCLCCNHWERKVTIPSTISRKRTS